MPFATNEEINVAHDILLKGKNPFDEQRLSIIKNDSSCYVQACPGSGKTTALLAKLIILANRMPLPEGKGVCVLTHTNVAIDEIKAKVGSKADILFRYPNFFGTIQAFLHKYVAAAALHYYYGSQIEYVDDDVAKAVLFNKFGKLDRKNKLKGFVYFQIISREHIITEEEIDSWGGVDTMIAARVIKKKGPRSTKFVFQFTDYDFENVPLAVQKSISLKKRSIIECETRDMISGAKIDWQNDKVIINQKQIGISSDSGSSFVSVKEEMFKEGILSFDDAYDLSFRYIEEKGLDFSGFSDNRFKYLFIDEVQDCDKQQVALIKKLFADDKVIVQRFGDYCQAIYKEDGSEGANNAELKDARVLYIRNSNRFGNKIAKPLHTLCMEDNSALIGNEDVYSVKPVIITYEDPLTVLPKFVELLGSIRIPEMGNLSIRAIANNERDEDPLHRLNVKACGWVGKKGATNQKRYIESYFPAFERKNVKTRAEGDSFDEFIPKNHTGSVKECAASLMQGVLKFLDLSDIRNEGHRYTRTSLLNFLLTSGIDKKNEFLSNIMSWSLVAENGNIEDVRQMKSDILRYITETMLPMFGKEASPESITFFNADNVAGVGNQAVDKGCVYFGEGVEVEVATVHSVKGETHAATLFLETFYDRYHESERLADQFKGIAYTGNDNNVIKSLKVAYVGMSRPRYLLCVAIQKDRFDVMDCEELRRIWDVVEA